MKNSSESEEEFFDAEEDTPNRFIKKRSPKTQLGEGFIFPDGNKTIDEVELQKPLRSHTNQSNQEHEFVEPKMSGRQRFRDLRQCMQNDEDENPGNTLTPDSQNSSVEGVFTQPRPTHPFRIIENDAISIHSMSSLGRVGRILAGSVDASNISIEKESSQSTVSSNAPTSMNPSVSSISPEASKSEENVKEDNRDSPVPLPVDSNNIIFQEPDVIASTKLAHSKTTDSLTSTGPIAPPRRKKKTRKLSTSSSEQFNMNEGFKLPPLENEEKLVVQLPTTKHDATNTTETTSLVSPATAAIESLTREIENSFTEATQSLKSQSSGSMGRISHSLGNSSTSVYSKPSPSNSSKSNSAPGRVASTIDPNQGLNLYKATRGQYVVKPQDDAANKAEGPSKEEMERIDRIRAEILGTNSKERINLAGTGTNSLGSGMRYAPIISSLQQAKERRKSAGDEDILKQLNIYVRTRTDSGKQLTDFEILEQVPVKNLDTGEKIPLSAVKPPPPPDGWNPLSLHIHKLTSHLEPPMEKESDEESVIGIPPETEPPQMDEDEGDNEDGGRLRKKTARLKRFIGSTMRKTVDKAKSIASEVSHARHKEDVADIIDVVNPEQNIKIKASSTNKGPYEFTKLQHVQDLSGEHTGAVWCMKFSSCGRLLATAGQDRVLRIWVLKDAYPFFQDMRNKYNADQKASPTPSQESLVSHNSAEEAIALQTAADQSSGPFMPKAFCSYTGHTSDLLDVSWSKNYFILSSSMDKTVRLWHISRRECLCCFQHIDFVTAIAFHPRDDRYFLSGSLDGKLRLWNIPDKKVALWNELDGQTKLITAANFCQNGKFAVVGSYDGRCLFYNTDQLKYHTQIHVRSTRGRNKTGRKISGIEPMPGEDKILVTSNDSRVRLYDLRDLNLSCKYKGYSNVSSQIKASFSHDGKYIIAGSENQCIYIWKTNHDYSKLSSVRRDRSDFWEGIKAHNATVTCAIFAPHPEAIIKSEPDDDDISRVSNPTATTTDPMVEQRKKSCGYVLISADFNGAIKVFINKTKPKHSSLPYTAILD
ncbi:WD repeat-containing protein 44 [Pseudolycoriella hygida]|uniref:WD repeat-containing protein 44 n=1 Tax=Pseudolycoriella hygida TaxID=35572 RepID=A0A9Q0MX79_9DIPT|nr:WD repeat-containing protein 44 [Pseudolycoriella hygida]